MKNAPLSRFALCVCMLLSVLQSRETVAGSSENRHGFSTLVRTKRQAQGTDDDDDGACILPERPKFGQWLVTGNSYGYSSQKASTSTIMRLSCNDGYLSKSDNKYIVCEGNKWSVSEIPTCLKKCGPISTTTNIIAVKCFDARNTEIKCDEATRGSRATFQCSSYFGASEYNSTDRYCPYGYWDLSEPVCPGCVLPEHPTYGQWSILGNNQGKPSQTVPFGTLLQFSCNASDVILSSTPYVICGGTEWAITEIPTCLKTCLPLNSTKHTTVKCFNNRKVEIRCDRATDDARATFQCDPYFEYAGKNFATRYCHEGNWNLPYPFCRPVCGQKIVSAEPLIINGRTVDTGNYPWVAALYHKQSDGSYLQVCSGSMLTENIILTVAHCVTDDNAVPKDNIEVGVGKLYNKYKDPRDMQAQYSKVHKVILPNDYRGDVQRFASNIAVLVTEKKFLLSNVVQPVCYQELPDFLITSTDVGVVTGWGFTANSGNPSEELREIDVPYKTRDECQTELPVDWLDKYYTYDKFCAGHYNKSTSACNGDSGAGLVFKHGGRYYVHGILSTHNWIEGGCNTQVSSLYTSVSVHYDWLEKTIAQNSN